MGAGPPRPGGRRAGRPPPWTGAPRRHPPRCRPTTPRHSACLPDRRHRSDARLQPRVAGRRTDPFMAPPVPLLPDAMEEVAFVAPQQQNWPGSPVGGGSNLGWMPARQGRGGSTGGDARGGSPDLQTVPDPSDRDRRPWPCRRPEAQVEARCRPPSPASGSASRGRAAWDWADRGLLRQVILLRRELLLLELGLLGGQLLLLDHRLLGASPAAPVGPAGQLRLATGRRAPRAAAPEAGQDLAAWGVANDERRCRPTLPAPAPTCRWWCDAPLNVAQRIIQR